MNDSNANSVGDNNNKKVHTIVGNQCALFDLLSKINQSVYRKVIKNHTFNVFIVIVQNADSLKNVINTVLSS